MRQIIIIMAVILSFIFPIDTQAGSKKNTPKSTNYTQFIRDWSDSTFANYPIEFRVANVTAYHDKKDPLVQRFRFLVVIKYDEVSMAFLLIVHPENGVERHTLLGSDFFNQPEEDDTLYYFELEEAET